MTVIATTRNPGRAGLLRDIGAEQVLIDDRQLAVQAGNLGAAVDGVFDLVGNSVLRDSLLIVRTRGRVCQLGFLGGLEPVKDFNPIADLPTGVQLSFYGSAFVLGTDTFPLTDIPLQEMIIKAEAGRYKAKPARVFGFNEIIQAHQAMEAGRRQDGRRRELTPRPITLLAHRKTRPDGSHTHRQPPKRARFAGRSSHRKGTRTGGRRPGSLQSCA
jgi:NADPH:quinone reductase-like Zn-dependent oxidoreductase